MIVCSKNLRCLLTNMQEKILEILKLRAELAEMEAAYKKASEPLKVQRDELQNTILETMRSEGEFSKRYETATISRAVRKTPKVIDERSVVKYLTIQGLSKEYVELRLKDEFDSYAKEAMKEGIHIPGLQINETEYLSISEAKSDKDRRKVTVEQ